MYLHIPLLEIYSIETEAQMPKHMGTSMCCYSMLCSGKTWMQPECVSTEEPLNQLWQAHIMEHYTATKKGMCQIC